MDIDSFIKDYINSESNPKATRLRKHNFDKFKSFLNGRSLVEVGVKEALEYQGWLLSCEQSYTSNTVDKYVSALSSFYIYLEKNNIVVVNPFKYIKRVRRNKRIPQNTFSEKEINHLLKALRGWNKYKHLKDRTSFYKAHVVAELMYSTGLKSFEVSRLKVSDIDLKNGYLIVNKDISDNPRKAILNGYVVSVLDVYINKMRELIFNDWNYSNGDSLFGLKEGSFNKFLNKRLEEAAKHTGIVNVTSNCFRNSLGYHLQRSGCGVRNIQQIVGHKSIKSSEVYSKVDKKDLKKVLNKYHPRVIKRIRNEVNHF